MDAEFHGQVILMAHGADAIGAAVSGSCALRFIDDASSASLT
jgi:hypothetical protein